MVDRWLLCHFLHKLTVKVCRAGKTAGVVQHIIAGCAHTHMYIVHVESMMRVSICMLLLTLPSFHVRCMHRLSLLDTQQNTGRGNGEVRLPVL